VTTAPFAGILWDLTVEGAHTFFVGPGAWLVHNCVNRPPIPSNPADPPGPDWVWRSSGEAPGSTRGAWTNPKTGESLHWDPNEKTHGPHWDWKDSHGNTWRVFDDGSMRLK
jgi:hypothetical protein